MPMRVCLRALPFSPGRQVLPLYLDAQVGVAQEEDRIGVFVSFLCLPSVVFDFFTTRRVLLSLSLVDG